MNVINVFLVTAFFSVIGYADQFRYGTITSESQAYCEEINSNEKSIRTIVVSKDSKLSLKVIGKDQQPKELLNVPTIRFDSPDGDEVYFNFIDSNDRFEIRGENFVREDEHGRILSGQGYLEYEGLLGLFYCEYLKF